MSHYRNLTPFALLKWLMVVLDAVLRYTQACTPSSNSAYLRSWHADVMQEVVIKFIDETTMRTGAARLGFAVLLEFFSAKGLNKGVPIEEAE